MLGADVSKRREMPMCDHCGCREITPIGRLMAEHEDLLRLAGEARAALRAGDEATARAVIADLAALLHPHTEAEERGLFAVMGRRAEFAGHIAGLEAEHAGLAARLAGPLGRAEITGICDRLSDHIQAEEYGLFPAALASLSGDDWEAVSTQIPPSAQMSHQRA